MAKKIFLLGVAYCLMILQTFAQVEATRTTMETTARGYFDTYYYHKALPLYLTLDSLYPETPDYLYPISICYLSSSNNEKALVYIEKCLKNPELYPPTLNFYAGRCYHLLHKMDDALKYYNRYLNELKNSRKSIKKNKKEIAETDRLMDMCNNGKEMMKTPLDIEVVNMGAPINTEFPEYGAVLNATENEIIFTSCRPNTTGGGIDPFDGDFYEDVYISTRTSRGWSNPVNLGSEINTEGHDASISITPDGQELIIYRYGDNSSSGDLLISKLEGENWTVATKLPPQINSKGWEPSACIAGDGRLMYFASNMKGGYGGTDIYMVRQLPNGEWALPVNMGPTVNTQYNEDSPFIHPDGKTFYFSSDGHTSMGGYDIFVTQWSDSTNKWAGVTNVGYPISTAQDDIHFTLSADGRRLYFSSIRPDGFGNKDIYYANIDKEAAHVLVMKGVVLDSLTLAPVNATIKVINQNTQEVVGVYNSNSSTGKYIMVLPEGSNYTIMVDSENYQLCNDNVSTIGLKDYTEMDKNIQLCPSK